MLVFNREQKASEGNKATKYEVTGEKREANHKPKESESFLSHYY